MGRRHQIIHRVNWIASHAEDPKIRNNVLALRRMILGMEPDELDDQISKERSNFAAQLNELRDLRREIRETKLKMRELTTGHPHHYANFESDDFKMGISIESMVYISFSLESGPERVAADMRIPHEVWHQMKTWLLAKKDAPEEIPLFGDWEEDWDNDWDDDD